MTVYLRITSWVGTSAIGAQHYYGVLRCAGSKPTRLTFVMTLNEADRANAYDNTPGLYEEGTESERFSSEEQVRARAQEVWQELYPESTELLVEGDGDEDE